MYDSKPKLRKAERDAACRVCDKWIRKGEQMISWYSYRNRGQNIHIHPECVDRLHALIHGEIDERTS